MTAKIKTKRKRIAPILRSKMKQRKTNPSPPRYASRMISNAIGYFSGPRWDVDGLISKRRRMALRLLALEQVLAEKDQGVLSGTMMQQLEAFR